MAVPSLENDSFNSIANSRVFGSFPFSFFFFFFFDAFICNNSVHLRVVKRNWVFFISASLSNLLVPTSPIWCSKNQVRNPSFLSHHTGKQLRIQIFQRNRTAPRVVLELNAITLFCHIHHMTKETLCNFPNVLPHPIAMRPSNNSSAPTSTSLPIWVASFPKHHSHFPSKAWLNSPNLWIPKPPASTGQTTFS